jgi:hypothetical protein
MTTRSAPVKVKPNPPTCDVSRNTGTRELGAWKRSTCAWRASAVASVPSMRQNGRPRASTAD